MNNFTTETIINTDLFSAANGVLKVKKVGNYKAADVVSVHKQPGSNAVKEIATITIPSWSRYKDISFTNYSKTSWS